MLTFVVTLTARSSHRFITGSCSVLVVCKMQVSYESLPLKCYGVQIALKQFDAHYASKKYRKRYISHCNNT